MKARLFNKKHEPVGPDLDIEPDAGVVLMNDMRVSPNMRTFVYTTAKLTADVGVVSFVEVEHAFVPFVAEGEP